MGNNVKVYCFSWLYNYGLPLIFVINTLNEGDYLVYIK